MDLHDRVNGLTEQLDRLETQLGAFATRQEDVAAAAGRAALALDPADRAAFAAENGAAAITEMRRELNGLTTDVAALAWREADVDVPVITDGPLVSVVMPTWQRAGWIAGAVRSVQAQTYEYWELVIVDDGSDDGTADVVAPLLGDARIRYVPTDHVGVSLARNRALAESTGDVVAFLDTDNTWHPSHLARQVQALTASPTALWSYSGQVLVDGRSGQAELRRDLRSPSSLGVANYIDLNVLAHRRSVLDQLGGFDAELPRLGDWDYVARLAELGPPVRTGAATVIYRTDSPGRITDTEPLHRTRHRVRALHRGLPAEGLKVLFAEWHFPQLTETYIAALAQGLTALGAEVEVWAQAQAATEGETTLRVHRGTLEDAISEFQPDLVLTHWLDKGAEFHPAVHKVALPHVVRAHGFDHDIGGMDALLAEEDVLVHTFPHLVEPRWAGHPRLSVQVTCFDDERYQPAEGKDHRFVLRTSAGLLTKDLDTFLLASALCPEHRFVLVLGHSYLVEERTEVLIDRAAELGSPVEILVDVPHDRMAMLMGEAGIYVHTHGTDHPAGMSMSIAEAVATGAYVLARDLPGIGEYLGGAGALYRGATTEERAADVARLVRATLEWPEPRWEDEARKAVDQAFSRYSSREVAEQMVDAWRATFSQLPASPTRF